MKHVCPDEEWLADYLEGRLSDRDRQITEEHLSDCETCLELILLESRILREKTADYSEPVPDAVIKNAVELIPFKDVVNYQRNQGVIKKSAIRIWEKMADVVAGIWGNMQPAAVRGSENRSLTDNYHVRKTFQDVDISIEIEKTGKETSHIRTILKTPSPDREIRITLMKDNREIYSVLPMEYYALFEDIPSGEYRLVFTRNGIEFGTYSFQIQ